MSAVQLLSRAKSSTNLRSVKPSSRALNSSRNGELDELNRDSRQRESRDQLLAIHCHERVCVLTKKHDRECCQHDHHMTSGISTEPILSPGYFAMSELIAALIGLSGRRTDSVGPKTPGGQVRNEGQHLPYVMT